jgi:hypothetical protein
MTTVLIILAVVIFAVGFVAIFNGSELEDDDRDDDGWGR